MTHRKLLAKVLFKKILYLGEKNYLIHRDGKIEEIGTDYSGKVRLIVLGKKYYFETLTTFPFSNIKDIRAAIKMDIPAFSPFKTDRFFIRKIADRDESTRVNLWFIDEKVYERSRDLAPFFLIPETALFSFLDEIRPRVCAIDLKDGESLFVYIGQYGAVKSMTSRHNRSNLLNFRRTVGAKAQDCPAKNIKGIEEYLALFPAILYGMPLKSLLGFTNPDSFSLNVNKKQLKMGMATAAFLFLLYTALSGLLPYYADKSLEEEDKTLSLSLSGLLKKQEMVDTYHKKQKKLAERINSYVYKLSLINLLNTILPEETTIRQLTVSGNMVEIRGTVPKASELLGALSQEKGIKKARFTSPLREDKKTGMEIFTLMLVYE
ncbi:MAG: PilN domain-containing protein [Desulfobacteraceae bacterium]|nr:PilN domain-containing protein [Desulfobacteraceae bacterium]MBC2720732.1 hypothetical protein [Desulfobacteraceae bacterium]